MLALTDPGPDAETALLIAAQGGDSESLERFCRGRFAWMRRLAMLQLGDAAMVDDAVQDAMIQLVRNLDRWDSSRPFQPWLATLIRNCAKQQRRSWRPWTPLVERLFAPRLDWGLDLERAAAATLKRLGSLSPGQRHAVYHVDVLDQSVAEVAEALGITSSTVRVQLHKGRKQLRERLGPWRSVLEDT